MVRAHKTTAVRPGMTWTGLTAKSVKEGIPATKTTTQHAI